MNDKKQTPAPASGGIRWDDVSANSEAAHLPKEVRDDYLWLKAYVREQCNRDTDLLIQIAEPLGIHLDRPD